MTGQRDVTPVIEQTLLAGLARHPGGDPSIADHLYVDRLVEQGWVVRDGDGVPHLTGQGWHALSPERQACVWRHAITEHATRQGPADAPTLRRLVLEYAWAEVAFRRLVSQGAAATAMSVHDEAALIKARLAVLVGVPVMLMDEVAVMLRARELADELDALTEADYSQPWAVDPRQRLIGVKACRNGGGLVRLTREGSEREMAAALVVS